MLSFALRLLGQFLVFLAVLLVIGFTLQSKMNDSLNRETEKFAARQGDMITFAYHNILQMELTQLSDYARLLSTEKLSPQDAIRIITSQKNEQAGLLDLTGNSVAGSALPAATRLQRTRALQGDSCWQYYPELGLVSMVPVYSGTNVRYVLYQLHTTMSLADSNSPLHISDRQDDEKILLYDIRTQQIVVPFAGYGPDSPFYDKAADAPLGLDSLMESIDSGKNAALFQPELSGDYLLYAAAVPDTTFIAIGYREWLSVLTGIRNIHLIVLWVFGLLVVLFCVFILYAFANQVAAEESTALREARDDALRANQAKSDFLANMSHEIRTPLNAILGMNEMIMREAGGNIKKYAFNIKSAGDTLLSIINDILDFSKIESGKMEIVPVSYSLSSVLNDVYNMVSYKAGQKGLSFHMEVDPTIPDALHGDEVRLRQVIVNILNNAVKYTPKGSVTFTVRGNARGEELGLELITKDTGIGIREEDKQKLFAKFQRLDIEKNRNIEGTGLGLAITVRLTEMMGGTISVDSVYGEGSTFTLHIPQIVEHDEPIGDFNARIEAALREEKRYHESFTAPDGRILVVDDNDMNLTVVESLLEKTQLQIDTADSGHAALDRLREKHYDIVFLDHMMPEMDGIETLQRAKEMTDSQNHDTPFIALTANAVAGVKEMFLEKGFDDYLSKPVDGKTLERMVQKYLPPEKVTPAENHDDSPAAATAAAAETTPAAPAEAPAPPDGQDEQIDLPTALKYCGGNEEMQKKFLQIFVSRREAVTAQLENDLQSVNIADYTTHVHALKSTAMSIGGVKLSECAKALEMAGHACCDGPEEERDEHLQYIQEHHHEAIELYQALAVEAKNRFNVQ